jgi:dienelactone hydrolase
MKKQRRDFIKTASLTGFGMAGGLLTPPNFAFSSDSKNYGMTKSDLSIIGPYGPWANGLISDQLPSLSYRNKRFSALESWRKEAMTTVKERMGIPDLGPIPEVTVHDTYRNDGLVFEEISWKLPYGNPTRALVIKPDGVVGKLPAILAFHDHGGNKYFGLRKITRTGKTQHPLMVAHQEHYYEGKAWANEIAKRGYLVMVPDAFTFASRRVLLEEVPENRRAGLTDENPEKEENIEAYNKWAADHEHVMAKSLFCGGSSWPAVFFAEDQMALEILLARKDVDSNNVGCGGLSGGGLRTVMMGGLDHRIKCAVCVGFMSTWTDFLLNRAYTHTWMAYIPRLPNELDFPEILGLRVPLPTLVLNDREDQLYTLPEMQKADKILASVFDKAGVSDKYKASYYPGLHKFDKAMQAEAFDWWDKWLKN